MADVEKISINNVSYDIKDASALHNNTTQTNGLAILGTTTAAPNGTAIGKDSVASYITTAVGANSQSYGVMSVSFGGWSNAGNSANVYDAVALGAGAQAMASGSIQLGNGVNTDAKTLKVALTDSQNLHAATDEASGLFTLLNSDGTIPSGRLTNAIQGAITSTTVTLAAASWSSNTQTVSVTGMTATSVVWVSPAGASMADYASGGVYCSAQASGTLTFTCSTAPSSDLTVQVIFG